MAAVSEREREKRAPQSVWGASPAGVTFGGGTHVGRREFFEVWRVLRPGGEVYFSVYNRNSIVYRGNMALVDQLLKRGWMKRSLKTRLAMGEYTTSGELPLVNVYSKRDLRARVAAAGFDVGSINVRKLVAEDLPLYGLPGSTARSARIPQDWLDRLGERWGWYVWAHGLKPTG